MKVDKIKKSLVECDIQSKFKILVSTTDDKFLERKNTPDSKYLIINQLIKKNKSQYNYDNMFIFKEKGLSRSRNSAIELCDSEIVLISDDDVQFIENIEEIVAKAFMENPDADIITFQVLTPDGKLFKNYSHHKYWHNIRTLMKVSSIEIAFKAKKIKNLGIKFDENFGLGSIFQTGEEFIFLTDALKKGLKILYLPIPIVIHPKESSGGRFNDENLIKAKGAMFYRVFGFWSYLISLLFAIKKHKLSDKSIFEFYKIMLNGIKEYKYLKNNNEI